jgi:hypothetical protein
MGRQWLKAPMADTPAHMEACAWMKVWQQGMVQLHDGQRLRLTHRGHGENVSLHEFHVFALKESQGAELFVAECPAIRADHRASDHHFTAQELDTGARFSRTPLQQAYAHSRD